MLALMLSIAMSPYIADHEATLSGNDIVWRSRIHTDTQRIELRRPIRADVTTTASILRNADGDVIGFEALAGYVDVTVRQPRRDGPMMAPLVPGIERIVFAPGVRFTPDAALGIEQRVGRFATPDVRHDDVNQLRAIFPNRARTDSLPIYLGPDATPAVNARGLAGTIVDVNARKWSVALTLLAACGGLIALLIACARLLSRRAAAERAERIIEQEWGSIG
jgi:hypothetical protein